MIWSRRSVVKSTGAVAAGAWAAPSLLQDFPYSTIEADLEYRIEPGSRDLPIHIYDVAPDALPPFAPAETGVDIGNVVFKLDVTAQLDTVAGTAEVLRLSLFQPKPSITDLSLLYDPPEYQGHGAKGNYLLSVAGNTAVPRREDTPLFNDFIAPNWDPATGTHFVMTWNDAGVVVDEWENAQWPGSRSSHAWSPGTAMLVPSPPGSTVPLRVSRAGVDQEGELFLLLLEIKRPHRLKLMARTVWVKPIIGNNICFVATAAFGTPMAPEIMVLRRWRDETLMRNGLGRAFVRTYYRLSPPLARFIARNERVGSVTRALLRPLVTWVGRGAGG